jgi:anthranilate 1,2-dioxygenase small subunit
MRHEQALPKLRVREFYEDYAACLDAQDMAAWPGFFTEDGHYLVQSRASRDGGFRIGDIYCDGMAMFRDRAAALRTTSVHEARIVRHFLGSLRVAAAPDGAAAAETSYLAVQSVIDEAPMIFSTGRTIDLIVDEADRLRFRRRLVVYDHSFIRGSLVFPL